MLEKSAYCASFASLFVVLAVKSASVQAAVQATHSDRFPLNGPNQDLPLALEPSSDRLLPQVPIETSKATEDSAEATATQPSKILENPTGGTIAQAGQRQQDTTSTTRITGVQLETSENGVRAILETSFGTALPSQTRTQNNTTIIDIDNATLDLGDRQSFRADNPAVGVASITVVQQTSNRVRMRLVGTNAAPTVETSSIDRGTVFTITPTVAQQEEPIRLVVTATRTEQKETDVPRAVSTIDREDIEEQTVLSRDLQDILSQQVPGISPPTQTSDPGASLRGRNPQVLIDGVPVRSNLSTVQARDLRTIDPASIENIEVLRGPTSLYGDGATGGVINITTRQPLEEDGVRSQAKVGISSSLGNLQGDSFGNTLSYSLDVKQGDFDASLNLTRDDTGSFFDAENDRIPRVGGSELGLADTETVNILGKFGINLGEDQRLQVSVNHFDDEENSNAFTEANPEPGLQKSRAVETDRDFVNAEEPRNRNTVVNLSYNHEDLLNSDIKTQVFYRNNENVFGAVDSRQFDITPAFIFRGINEKEQWGVRLQADTSITDDINVLWGADYTDESVEQPFELFDVEAFDRSGGRVLSKTGETTSIPEYEFTNFGLFAQVQWDVTEDLSLSGGVRQEKLGFNVDDYTLTVFQDSPRNIKGGGLNFSNTTFNVGATYDITNNLNIYASFSQGFSAPDFGRFLRSPPEGFQAIESDVDITKPQEVDNYELGIRSNWSSVQASLVGFFNHSDRGVNVVPPQSGEALSTIQRQEQRIYGIEAAVDWQPGDKWNVGSTFTWSEGDQEDDNGDFEPLRSNRISPIKVTAYVQNETLPGWNNRLQMLYVGNRDRAFDEGVDPVSIESYITFDLISSINLGGGTLQLGIENLFDEQFTTVTNQVAGGFTESRNVAARGRRISLEYSISW